MPINHFDIISGVYHRWGRFDPQHPLLGLLDLPSQGLIIDVGGGTGRVARLLAAPGRPVVVVDVSTGMLRRARGLSDIWPVMADAAHLPFESGAAVRCLIVDALHHIPSQQASIDELCRALQPGGILVVDEPDLRVFAVKLIRIGEWLLWMGSHFLNQDQLEALFDLHPGKIDVKAWQGSLMLRFTKVK
jgi:ubiquinone/menaquinone biosynthesis C-methylase UbiE